MMSIETAAQLIDFGARLGSGRMAEAQLSGAVALHNILSTRKVAYLADEVGMGKTYVALGAVALFRHFKPDFRLLVIAPRENIQQKWIKEFGNFVANNVRFPDLRVKALDGRPARALVACQNLPDFVRETQLNPDRDFFLRMSSFSLAVAGDGEVDKASMHRFRDRLREALPWVSEELFDLRIDKRTFKDNISRAVCCGIPKFDLVIVDEAHNLKHGHSDSQTVSARNRSLAFAIGGADLKADQRLFPGYGRRAERVLFLSATPVEDSYTQLWNQLDVFGHGTAYEKLRDIGADDQRGKDIARQFLIRRVTALNVGGVEHTKNLYRREWRNGGVHAHDEPIRIEDLRQKLIVALIQKKVSEVLRQKRFNNSFQIGMLASFESFLETARLKQTPDASSSFDDKDQAADLESREGIDVADINRLSRAYRNKFGTEMPHPKMDAVVDALAGAWHNGRKALVFVRRVASVKELKQKLDDRYDLWLKARLKDELPPDMQPRLARIFEEYDKKHGEYLEAKKWDVEPQLLDRDGEEANRGGADTFFAWFFRGDGPKGLVSGASVQQRFVQSGTVYSTYFEDNYVADLLACRTGDVTRRLAEVLDIGEEQLRHELRHRSREFLTLARNPARSDRFEAAQAAAIELIQEKAGPLQKRARAIWRQRFSSSKRYPHASEVPEVGDLLELPTFFSQLRERSELRKRLWPVSSEEDEGQAFREQELRRHMLASAARLGHAFIDLYVLTMRRIGSFEPGAADTPEDSVRDAATTRIDDFLDHLERQMETPRAERGWGAFDELADMAANFDLILDVNAPRARETALASTARDFGQLLRQQQPVGGMSGQINQTLVKQFRMPGYPLVLITTELLQEGEDLHTFCSDIYHYGIAWTPSSMEQRTGRIDRVRSQTERRLSALGSSHIAGNDMLQVYFPHLQDTIEVLQVERVLARMNEFLRLMHEGLVNQTPGERTIDAVKEMVRIRQSAPPARAPLKSAFPVPQSQIGEGRVPSCVTPDYAEALRVRFGGLGRCKLPGLDIEWERQTDEGILYGTARLKHRIQPFTLLLRSLGAYPSVRCISPVGLVNPDTLQEQIVARDGGGASIGAIRTAQPQTYDLTVEAEVLLAADATTDARRIAALIRRVITQADSMEQNMLRDKDEPLRTFQTQLSEEATRGRKLAEPLQVARPQGRRQ